jgi:hypothetical protein
LRELAHELYMTLFDIGALRNSGAKVRGKIGTNVEKFYGGFFIETWEKARYRNVIDLPIFVQSPKSCTADSSCCSMQGQQQKQ